MLERQIFQKLLISLLVTSGPFYHATDTRRRHRVKENGKYNGVKWGKNFRSTFYGAFL